MQSTGLLGNYEIIPSVRWEVVAEETWLDWTAGWGTLGVTLAARNSERLQEVFYNGFPPHLPLG